jgi:TolA-binding protein
MTDAVCAWIERDDVFESYVRDALGPEDRDAFEAHYFECAACADRLQTYSTLRAELAALPAEDAVAEPARGWPWRWVLVPLAGSLVLVAAAALWFRSAAPAVPEAAVASAPAAQPPVAARPTEPPVPEQTPQAVTPQTPASRRMSQPVSPPAVALSVLARVDPPLYVPVALRGPRDEAAEAFDAAMRLYVGGDYAGAIPGLGTAAGLRPDAPQIAFFLAACRLLTGEVSAAASGFESVIALGDSPYLEEAHFYLAKARIRQGRLPAAREELRKTVDCHGRLEPDARRLLAQLDALPAK